MDRRTFLHRAGTGIAGITFSLGVAPSGRAFADEAEAPEEPAPIGPEVHGLSVTELQLGTSYSDGVVGSTGTSFSHDEPRLFAVVRVRNRTRAEQSVQVSFEPADGPSRSGVRLAIPARPRWRTVARTSPRRLEPGNYKVVVRTGRRRSLLAEVPFTITE